MRVTVESLAIPDVKLVTPEVFRDERGFFVELFRLDVHEGEGLPTHYPQVNLSRSRLRSVGSWYATSTSRTPAGSKPLPYSVPHTRSRRAAVTSRTSARPAWSDGWPRGSPPRRRPARRWA